MAAGVYALYNNGRARSRSYLDPALYKYTKHEETRKHAHAHTGQTNSLSRLFCPVFRSDHRFVEGLWREILEEVVDPRFVIGIIICPCPVPNEWIQLLRTVRPLEVIEDIVNVI